MRLGPIALLLLAVVLFALGLEDPAGAPIGVIVVAIGLVLSALWRLLGPIPPNGLEAIPTGVVLLYIVLAAPPTVVSEVLAGLAGLTLLLWISDVSRASPHALLRGFDQLLMPAAGFAVALGISFTVPVGPLSLGFASLALVLVILLVVLILSRPGLVGRREAPGS